MSGAVTMGARAALARFACAGLSFYFRRVPLAAGKAWLWHRVVRPYLSWRPLPIEARAAFGARFDGAMPDIIHTYLYFFGQWEPAVTRYLRAVLRPGDVVIDVGANVGAHTLLAAHLVGAAGRVHAIEASPTIFASLRRNLALNRAANVVAHNIAVADAPGTLTVYLNEEYNRGGTTVMRAEAQTMAATVEATVPCDTLGAIVPDADLRRARLVKIDVEGAEWMVLQGMRATLPRLAEDAEILLEMNADALARSGGSVASVLDLLAAHGFEPLVMPNAYQVEFYVRPPRVALQPYRGQEFGLGDFVFRKRAPPRSSAEQRGA